MKEWWYIKDDDEERVVVTSLSYDEMAQEVARLNSEWPERFSLHGATEKLR